MNKATKRVEAGSANVLTGLVPHPNGNKLRPEDRAVHDWYRFVLSFPPHLVRHYVKEFGLSGESCVLDPFCGTGTTLVECKKQGIPSIGVEANPMAHFASKVKTNWQVDGGNLITQSERVAAKATGLLEAQGIGEFDGLPLFDGGSKRDASLQGLPPDAERLLLKDSISDIPLHKCLTLLGILDEKADEEVMDHQRLALAKIIVFTASNLHFGPEVGIGPAKHDAPVVSAWLREIATMAGDLQREWLTANVPSAVVSGDARYIESLVEPNSIDAVITSPPYPNEKDYTRTTRLESVILGFIRGRNDLRALKQGLVRSNTRNVYKNDEDDQFVSQHPEVQRLAEQIEQRRIELGKTSGWERMYARVTKLYFGGMARHLQDLKPVLRPGAYLAYVVGDQASYLRVMIRTGRILADIASSLGYELLGIELFRTRRATATRDELREEVVLLRWPG